MKMVIVVESEADYQKWLATQKTFGAKDAPAAAPADTTKPKMAVN
jgi:heme/copper-type cytochrome/quinol oxidase subunit 2